MDDFLFVGTPDTEQYKGMMEHFMALAERLGLLLAKDKTEGPTTCLTFLGIELDSKEGVSRSQTKRYKT